MGSTYAKVGGSNVPFDSHDLRQPSIENGALFVITKIEAIKQQRGECGNPEYACAVASDCPIIDGISAQECDEGACVMKGWCPGLDPNADETMVVRIERPQDLVLWFRSAIAFPGLQPNVTFSSMNHEEPTFAEDNGETDAWTIKELLDIAEAPVRNIIEDGALINVRLEWDCEIDSGKGCAHPQAQVKRLDSGKVRGFSYYKPEYEREPTLNLAKDIRLLYKYTGIRILVSSKGDGKQFSITATILQFSSGLALLGLAKTITDACMLYVMPQKDHYRKYKEELTPDFSDLRDKISEDDGAQKRIRERQNRYAVRTTETV